ncbi:hypothetical protein ACF08W_29230 [Streptomyces sp. NPDC015144]|uniref:hypothetical protein n=1 Tax=Streptomyces sp. NPDC015144 TaxID=3364944 RepID=UPI0036FBD0CD
MERVTFTVKDISTLRQAARFLRAMELQLPATAHDMTHTGVLTSAMWLDHQADKLVAAPQPPSRETRRPIFNHLVAPAAGGPVFHVQAKAMLDEHEAAVRAEVLADPEAVRAAVARLDQGDAAAEDDAAHRCNLPPTRRLPCGCCPHELCEDCERCGHTCTCSRVPEVLEK